MWWWILLLDSQYAWYTTFLSYALSHPVLTLSWRSGLAPAPSRSSTTFWWPSLLATCSAVQQFCTVEWVKVTTWDDCTWTVWWKCTRAVWWKWLVSKFSSSDLYIICYICSDNNPACTSWLEHIHEIHYSNLFRHKLQMDALHTVVNHLGQVFLKHYINICHDFQACLHLSSFFMPAST